MGEKLELDKQPAVKSNIVSRAATPERFAEFIVGAGMVAFENVHDVNLVPEIYFSTRKQVGPLLSPDNPAMKWAVDHIGDIWEISVGFMALRSVFFITNEVLKKTTGKEISDDACFWASLAITMATVSTHSLGMWSGPYHSHVGAPVPEMLFGQVVAAAVLTSTHLTVKHREDIRGLAEKTGTKIVDGGKFINGKIDEFVERYHQL